MSIRYPRKFGWWLAGICAAVAALVLMRVIQHMNEDVKKVYCSKHLQLIGYALQTYESAHGSLPPAFVTDKAGRPTVSWRVLILPYLGYDDLFRQIRLDEPWDSPHNLPLARLMPDEYRCPADTEAKEGETSYVAVTGAETLWPGAKGKRLRDLGGRSLTTTILLVEVAHSGISWMEPRDLPFEVAAKGVTNGGKSGVVCCHPCWGGDEGVYNGYNPGVVGCRLYGANCLFAIGFVRTVSDAVSPETMAQLLTAENDPNHCIHTWDYGHLVTQY